MSIAACRFGGTVRTNPWINFMSVVSLDLLRKFDLRGPRYTSYPAADRFVEAFAEGEYVQALKQRRFGVLASTLPLSLYAHLPLCEPLSYRYGSNKSINKHHEEADRYVRYLSREIDLHTAHLGSASLVSQLHLGGGTPGTPGTPTFLSDEQLGVLMATLRRSFSFVPGGDYAIEVDPCAVDADRLAVLAGQGFNRLIFGVQDFHLNIQQASRHTQLTEQVFALVDAARKLRFESINVDLIYGLPQQTPESFNRSLAQITALKPDRVALYSYAHLPKRFKPQSRAATAELPNASAKIAMLAHLLDAFDAAGYVYVGLDHFALPGDALAIAKRQGRLHRNFQGYSARADGDFIALGVSAIGRVGATYKQNAKTLDEYYNHLDQGRLPVVRGLALSRDDLVRRAVIMSLMCQGEAQFEPIENAYLIDFKSYFANEFDALLGLENQGLVKVTDTGIQVTAAGWFVVRAVAMVFDRYLQTDLNRARFSKNI